MYKICIIKVSNDKEETKMKVNLTTGHCNPPLTQTLECDTLRYFDNKRKLTMYDKKGKVIAFAMVDEWLSIIYIDNDGQEHFIKRGN